LNENFAVQQAIAKIRGFSKYPLSLEIVGKLLS
jgi:hypothetical protein